jgi:DNA-binding NtrC family response regulator
VANLGAQVWNQLATWPWPGNVRELRNAVARAVAHAGDELPSSVAPLGGRTAIADEVPRNTGVAAGDFDRPFVEVREEIVERFEREYLTRMLELHQQRITRAADAAGLDRSYFRRLLRKYRIDG